MSGKTTDKKSFIFYHEWKEILQRLPADEIGKVVIALVEYSESGEIPELSPMAELVFIMFKQTIDKDTEKWENVCQKNAENGKKGGRPKKADGNLQKPKKADGFLENPKEPKKADNDNEYDNEYDNENNLPSLPPEGGAPPDGGGCGFSQGNDDFRKKPKCQSLKTIIESYTQNEDLKTAILDFKEMRERMRKPLTEKALRMVLKKADELGNSDEIKIKLFEQSTEHGWLSLYPIKQEQLQQSRHPPQSSGNPFLDMLKDIKESERNTVDISGNVAGNGNSQSCLP